MDRGTTQIRTEVSPDATVDVTPKPVQKPGPGVLLGGAAEPAVRRAGRLGDGWITPVVKSVADIERDVERIADECTKRYMNGEYTTCVLRDFFVGDSMADSWDRFEVACLYLHRKYAEGSRRRTRTSYPTPTSKQYRRRRRHQGQCYLRFSPKRSSSNSKR